jgi:acetylornithine deacetylase/succinyl-diaminopimelate desuccinylase-like protein
MYIRNIAVGLCRSIWARAFVCLMMPVVVRAQIDWTKVDAEALEYFTKMVQIDTSFPPGNETDLAKYLQGILEREGIPSQLTGSDLKRLTLIARLKGSGVKKPILVMGHSDVVPVARDRWTEDPFGAKRIDGYIWGRGTSDDKSIVTGALMTILLLKRSGVPLDRDVIFVAESGEEGGGRVAGPPSFGIRYLIEHNWPDIDAEYCLTEGGSLVSAGGKLRYQKVQLSDKVGRGMRLVAHGTSGHGSMPREDNAIVHLSAAVAKVAAWQPPMRLIDITRTYFERLAQISSPEDAQRYKDLFDSSKTAEVQRYFRENNIEVNALLHTTISPNMISGGIKQNVIPSEATATLDIRAVPGEDMEKFKAEMKRAIADPAVEIESGNFQAATAPPSSMDTEMYRTLEAMQRQLHPGIVTLPSMSTGGTDMSPLRIKGMQCYGIGPERPIEDAVTHAAHSDNERLKEASLYDFVRYEYEVVKKIASHESGN